MTTSEPLPAAPSQPPAKGGWFGLLLLWAWVLIVTFLAQLFTWSLEQFDFEASLPNFGILRMGIALAYAVAMLVQFWILARNPNARHRRLHTAWMWASLFALCLAPSRLPRLYATQLTALLQIGGALAYIGLLTLAGRRATGQGRLAARGPAWPLALIVGLLVGAPWLAWGALGSPLDTLLDLGAAAAFGTAAALTFVRLLPPGEDLRDRIIGGFAAATALILMATGFGTSGLAAILAVTLAPLGWAAYALRSDVSPDRRSAWLPVALLVGLAAGLPMALLDPAELSVVITGDAGDLMSWAVHGMLVALAISVFIGLALALFYPWLRERLAGAALKGAAALALLAGIGVYAFIGQPGFFGERLFVILKSQADLTAAAALPDRGARRTAVYQALVGQAEATQADLRRALGRAGIAYTPYYLVNGLEVRAGPIVGWWLERQPEVDRVLRNPELRPLPAPPPAARGDAPAPTAPPWNLTLIGADRVWKELGVTGKGVVIGQSDSGVQGDHPELRASYRGANAGDDGNWYDPWYGTRHPTDINGHGTHTLGTILGVHTGVAPGAEWIGCVNLARNLGNPALYLDCMQFMLAPFPQGGDAFKDGDPARGADVLNNSWGCPELEGCDATSLLPAVYALRAAGIFVVASTGNDGDLGCSSVTDPLALYAQVYSVGAIDRAGRLASFSSLGPVTVDGSRRVKPDIVAPGVDVLSAFPDSTYKLASGTSMAGPHVAGVVALMWSANPALAGDVARTQQILDETAGVYKGPFPTCVDSSQQPNDAVGYGVVDAYAAVQAALAVK